MSEHSIRATARAGEAWEIAQKDTSFSGLMIMVSLLFFSPLTFLRHSFDSWAGRGLE